jgi:TolB-like protein
MNSGPPCWHAPEAGVFAKLENRTTSPRLIRFGAFEADLQAGELRKSGVKLKLAGQAFQILAILLERPGSVVTREELRKRLWPDTVVDFDHNLNAAINRIREALADSARGPRFVETLARRGYRFVAPAVSVQSDEPDTRPAEEAGPEVARAEDGFGIAVLPFRYSGVNAGISALAEGFSEDVLAGLQRFSYLRVIASRGPSRYSQDAVDVRSIAGELGARYVIDGSLREAESRLRIAAQLVDVRSATTLWAETWERSFQAESVFELQDDLVPRIVSTVGDARGVLPRTISEALRNRDPESMTPHEAVLRSFAHFQRVSAEEHAPARAALERAVQRAPGNTDCWAMLSLIYKEEYTHGFNLRPDPLGRAFAAAQRAIESGPSNHLGYHALASVLFFRREVQAFRSAAERAITLNPMDGFTIAYLGFLTAYSGEWERGCALVERARNLNPHHPGWYWFAHVFDAYRRCDYHGAVRLSLKINMPGFWRTNVALAAAYGQLGEEEAARNALQALLTLRPDFASVAREELRKWWDPELVEHLIDGLRKAGLAVSG